MTDNYKNSIKIMLVDDHLLMLDGLKSLLGEEDDFIIVASFSSAEEALNLLNREQIDLLIADIHLPGMSGIELTRKVSEKFSSVKVLALTMHNEASLINQMIEAGAWGYVIKSNKINELVEAIRTINSGQKYLSKEVQSIIMDSIFRPDNAIHEIKQNVPSLTNRELEILNLIAAEYSNREIAEKLFISERTVETHRKNIFTKTKTKTVAGLIRYALENHLIKK
jgi:DNA-binding NarL/FixJ family response regulator